MITDFLALLSSNIVFFIVLWFVFHFFARVSWVDVLWAGVIGLWSLMHLREAFIFDYGMAPLALSAITLIWSSRLTLHLCTRLMKNPGEDRRYEDIKESNPSSWTAKSFLIFITNAVLVSVLLLPQRVLILDLSQAPLSFVQILGFLICMISICGESVADSQLRNFLVANKGRTCQSGLWKYSRHPNYFFEWLFWLGASLCALPMENGAWALTAPLLMFIFLNYFTGVKVSESDAEKRRPDFTAYKKKTSAFFLWFPRS